VAGLYLVKFGEIDEMRSFCYGLDVIIKPSQKREVIRIVLYNADDLLNHLENHF
jgi:hypothetical protein